MIAFDTSTGAFNNSLSYGASLTWAHTTTGSDRVLYVGVISKNASSITGVTYGGVAMTLVDDYPNNGPGLFTQTILFVLKNPSSGSNTVSVQTTGGGTGNVYAKAASYTGANQTTPVPHIGKTTGTGTTLTLTINTSNSPSTDNCWLVAVGATDGNYSQTAGAGTTRRTGDASIDNWISFFDTNAVITPPGSDSLVVNIGTSSEIDIIGGSLAPSAAPATANGNFFQFM